MKEYVVTFRSVTFAQRGQLVLQNAGISATLGRTPRFLEEQGCGYCLHIRSGFQGAVQALRKGGVSFGRAYLHWPGDQWEEMEV